MTQQRSTQEEFQIRCEDAADLLAEGYPGRGVVKLLSTKYNVTPQQARAYVREGRKLLIESVGVENRAALFSQVFAGLQMDRLEARQSGNSSAAVGASKAMVQMLKQLADIDPMRDFENKFMETVAPGLNNNRGSIPRTSIKKQPPIWDAIGGNEPDEIPF